MIYRFGGFALDSGARQLVSPDGELHVSPKAFELLWMLLEAAPRAVSKIEIQERIWPATFVQETNIAGLVSEVRGVLGTAGDPEFIRTLYRFGYRFTGGAGGGVRRHTARPFVRACRPHPDRTGSEYHHRLAHRTHRRSCPEMPCSGGRRPGRRAPRG
jgi:DNA-binding winged helix-turn-helix (wHTH) protein